MFRKGHGRQRAVEPRRKHRLAAAGRPRQHEMVTTSPTTRAILSSIGSSNMSSKSGESSARAVSVVPRRPLEDACKHPFEHLRKIGERRIFSVRSVVANRSCKFQRSRAFSGATTSPQDSEPAPPPQSSRFRAQDADCHRVQARRKEPAAYVGYGGPALIVNAMAIANGVKLAAVFAYRGRKG